MKLNIKQDLFPLRSCLNCGSWFRLRTFFCNHCHEKLLTQFYSPSVTLVHELKVKSLLRWPPGKSDVLSGLVLQMKTENANAWDIWANEFVYRWQPNMKTKSILLSSESTSGKKHAQNWADSLANLLGYPHHCPLVPVPTAKKQRELTKYERSRRTFDIHVDFSSLRHKRVIFVDDVVTTGHTALAAYEALKKPSNFEVWSLIYREL